MKTQITSLSMKAVRKMVDAAENEARKLGVAVGIAVVASDASVFFTRSMPEVASIFTRDVMKRAMDSLDKESAHGVQFITNESVRLGAIVVDGADALKNEQCAQAALKAIEG